MTLGALLDLGVSEQLLRKELDKLGINGYTLVVAKCAKSGIIGTDIDVILVESQNNEHNARNTKEIMKIIDDSELSEKVKVFSKNVFMEIAAAEAKLHGENIDEVRFHDAGAIDSVVDVVGTAICLDLLGVDRVYASELHDGHGFIECRHGTIPVPVPAVMAMLSGTDIPLIQTDIETELVTPTGMGKREYNGFGALRIVMGNTK